jgi:hypothetical protein
MQIKYVGPFDAVELDGVGVVAAGQTIDVDPAVAGHAPSPRLAAAHLELHAAIGALDHELAKALREEIIGLDPGAGLLAQSDNWQAVTTTKSSKAATSEGDGTNVP